MRKIVYYYLLFFILQTLFLSCTAAENEKEYLRGELKSFMESSICIPQNLTMVRQGKPFPFIPQDSLPILITFIDENECSDCRLSHLFEYDGLFQLSYDSNAFQFLIIFSPSENEKESVLEKLFESNYTFPILFDSYAEFKTLNHIPSDLRFHTFLIDKDKHPIMVGSPLINKRVEALFFKLIKTKK